MNIDLITHGLHIQSFKFRQLVGPEISCAENLIINLYLNLWYGARKLHDVYKKQLVFC